MSLQSLTSIASVLVSFAALMLSAIAFNATRRRYAIEDAKRRKDEKEEAERKSDVLSWAQRCIRQLELLHIVFITKPQDFRKRLADIAYETAVLIGEGRLFFKNTQEGWRPKILDELKIAHYLAMQFVETGDETWARRQFLAYRALRNFIELAQEEVGRRTSIAKRPSEGGISIDLNSLLRSVSESELTHYFENLRT